MTSKRGRRPKRVKPGARVTEGPMAEYSEPPRSRRPARHGEGGGGVPLPLIIGGVVAGVVLLGGVIYALSGGSSAGGGGTGGARKAAAAYLAAWKSGDVEALVAMEHLSKSDAENLCDDYRRKVVAATSAKRIPTKARAPGLHRAALLQMGDLDFARPDKQALAREIIAIAYKMYFGEGNPKISYEIKGVDASGDDAAKVRVACSATMEKKDPPELVLITQVASSGRLSLVRAGGKWKIGRQ